MVEAWKWQETDRIYNVLPLHHVHGVVNVVTTSLFSGACCEMPGAFDADATVLFLMRMMCYVDSKQWERFAQGGLSLFMAVPTVYAKLIAKYATYPEARQKELESFILSSVS
jgi:malonyl-CoA/methylmalonyl-CoA synthetase